ncbi:unnamed protein product [Caenorhabditis angaria]|uniref:Serpentine receptor class r-10 n=1 Tax=Caenorhabditis angaria TaxID=860376 RepID=A0A9P1IR12_9PELO|nr:unnamed protein product [Caenorhabditis angaria]
MTLNTVIDLTQKISAVLSIFLNCFLTFLIICKSPKQLGSYKYLMLYISWFEIIYSILDVITSPVMFSHGSILVSIVYIKNSKIADWVALILNSVYCSFCGISMGMFGINFIYRYFVSTGSKYLKTFNGFKIIFWMMIPVVYGLIWGFIAYVILGPSKEIDEQLSEPLMLTFGWEIQDISYVGAYFYQIQSDGSLIIDYKSVVSVSITFAIVFSSFLVMCFCGIRCYIKINTLLNITNKHNFSTQSKNLQSQLFYALVTQTIIPVILMHFPVSTVFVFTFLDKDLGFLSGITSITIALFPALDPIPAMFIIKSYRKSIFGFFKITKVKSIQIPRN